MSSTTFTLSAFGDEIDNDLQTQLQTLRDLHIDHLELRGVWGKNVSALTDDEVSRVQQICADSSISISGIGSPVGKSPVEAPLKIEVSRLTRLFEIAARLDTRYIRVFSFYPPDRADPEAYVETAVARLAHLTDLASKAGFTLLLENEKGIVGDTVARCHAILSAINNPHLRFAWDPANFVQVGVEQPTTCGWSLLGEYVAHVHIKDAVLSDGTVCPAGEGDGQIGELLSVLRDSNYRGFLALEPHLLVAGHSTGFSGSQGMAQAVKSLRQLMTRMRCIEAKGL